jgi:hypothetical protein
VGTTERIIQEQGEEVAAAAARTPKPEPVRTWPEYAKPTPEQFLDYFLACDRDRQLRIITSMRDDQDRAMRCFIGNHERNIERLLAENRAHRMTQQCAPAAPTATPRYMG